MNNYLLRGTKKRKRRKRTVFEPAGLELGYVMLQARRIRPIFFFLFPGERYCEIVQEQPPISTVVGASPGFCLTRSTVRALAMALHPRTQMILSNLAGLKQSKDSAFRRH